MLGMSVNRNRLCSDGLHYISLILPSAQNGDIHNYVECSIVYFIMLNALIHECFDLNFVFNVV